MKAWSILCLSVLLSACASVSTLPRTESVLNDRLFQPPSVRIDAADVFALSDQMQRYLKNEIAPLASTKGGTSALVEALYNKQQLKLEYESTMTRNASQAFDSRSGNCLSLVIMTTAFAKQLGVNVEFQSVFVDEAWSRKSNIHFLNGHVNLILGRAPKSHFNYMGDPPMLVDFLPAEESRGYRRLSISENTIVAMYMNNRAAESLAVNKLDDAYWWAREAIRQAPAFTSAYNTLGVIYQAHGNLNEAAQVFNSILQWEPGNVVAMSNQSQVFLALGRAEEAKALVSRLEKIEPYPPFYFFDRGMAAMREGNFQAAKELFGKEVSRAAYYHEFQFWLGIATLRLGEVKEARQHIAIALENGPDIADRNLYSAKLEQMKFNALR
ncbi:MAG: tetratricopeptide repeat protein [Pseudomonadota bacterium]